MKNKLTITALCLISGCGFYWIYKTTFQLKGMTVDDEPVEVELAPLQKALELVTYTAKPIEYEFIKDSNHVVDCLKGPDETLYRAYFEYLKDEQNMIRVMNSDFSNPHDYKGGWVVEGDVKTGTPIFKFYFKEKVDLIQDPKTFKERSFNRANIHSIHPKTTYLLMSFKTDRTVQWAKVTTPDTVEETIHFLISPIESKELNELFKKAQPEMAETDVRMRYKY